MIFHPTDVALAFTAEELSFWKASPFSAKEAFLSQKDVNNSHRIIEHHSHFEPGGIFRTLECKYTLMGIERK